MDIKNETLKKMALIGLTGAAISVAAIGLHKATEKAPQNHTHPEINRAEHWFYDGCPNCGLG
jgi:hypothetical protein